MLKQIEKENQKQRTVQKILNVQQLIEPRKMTPPPTTAAVPAADFPKFNKKPLKKAKKIVRSANDSSNSSDSSSIRGGRKGKRLNDHFQS